MNARARGRSRSVSAFAVALALASTFGCTRSFPAVVQPQTFEAAEDQTLSAAIAVRNERGDALRFDVVERPRHGVIELEPATGAFSYRPEPQFNGADSFRIAVSPKTSAREEAAIAIVVAPVNDAPVPSSMAFQTEEDVAFVGTVSASDVDGDSLGFAVARLPRHGRVELAANGAFSYTPDRDYVGTDDFRFSASDGVATELGEVLIGVTPVNDAPVAPGATLTVGQGGTILGALWGSDVDGDSLTYRITRSPARGSLTFDEATHVFQYRPAAGFSGSDSFEYAASDGDAESPPATQAITVLPDTNLAPQILAHGGDTSAFRGAAATRGVTVSGTAPFTFKWWKNGKLVTGATGPTYTLPPARPDDDGTSYAVTFYDARSSVNGPPWTFSVLEWADGNVVRRRHSNAGPIYPVRSTLSVERLERPASGIGAKFMLRSSGPMPALALSGEGSLAADPAGSGSVVVSFVDPGTAALQRGRVQFRDPGGVLRDAFELTFANAPWLAQQGVAGTPEVTLSRLDVPIESAEVEDWVIGQPSTGDVAFAQATWGDVVSRESSQTGKARALARAIMDALEAHRGIPSNRMNASSPFDQYRLAIAGEGEVWCTNIAAILAHACKAFGIQARTIGLGRTREVASDFVLSTSEGHASTEVFDEALNRWVWLDATLYVLGAEDAGGAPLTLAEFQRSFNDPTAPPFEILDYDPGTGLDTRSLGSESRLVPSLQRFITPDTRLTLNRLGLRRETVFDDNAGFIYPRLEPIALRDVRIAPGGYGVELTVASDLPGPVTFEYTEIASSEQDADLVPRLSSDGRIVLRFANPHSPLGRSKEYRVRAVSAGQSSPTYDVAVRFYSREFYASSGLTLPGQLIFDARALPAVQSAVLDWIVDWPTLEDARFAERTWSSRLPAGQPAGARARSLAAAIVTELSPVMGSAPESGAEPFERYRRAIAGQGVVTAKALASIVAHACNALGIPARLVQMGRTISDGPGFRLVAAEARSVVEVFDSSTNRWVWLDPASGIVGAEVTGGGVLDTAGLIDAVHRTTPGRLRFLRVAGQEGDVTPVPSGDPTSAALMGYLATHPALEYARVGATVR